jgi:curved DNA-binding protein
VRFVFGVMTTLDPYATLGIPAGASRAEAARAHRRLAKRYHPDLNRRPDAAERMRRINEAWRILSDPVRRAHHDTGRSAATSWSGASQAWGSPTGGSRSTWTSWPDSRRTAPRTRRPPRPEPIEPSFGDHPAVVAAIGVGVALFVFLGTWIGSVTR